MNITFNWTKEIWIQNYMTELFLFLISIAAAYFLGWNNTDLIWSFWITSLVIGYISIFRTSVAPFSLFTKYKLTSKDIKMVKDQATFKKLITIITFLIFVTIVLFQIVFLSLHFFIFHLILAYWLQELMPNVYITDILANSNAGSFYIPIQIIKTLLLYYWMIILEKLIFDYKTNRANSNNKTSDVQQPSIYEAFTYEGIKRPYIQVVRIIILIILLLLLNETGISQFLVYVLIFSLFFFPISIIMKVKS